MRRCDACAVNIEGEWQACPLCGEGIGGEGGALPGSPTRGAQSSADLAGGTDLVPSPFPDPPLRFSRRRLLKVLFLTSVAATLVSVVIQLVFRTWFEGLGERRYVWLGVVTMWLVVLTAVRQRHNVAKAALYWVVIVSLLAAYWDYFTGWEAWSLTYAIPIVAAFALVAMLIITWGTQMEPRECVIYSLLAAIFGLVPAIFLIVGLVTDPWASIVCVVLSVVTLVVIAFARGRHIRHEVRKRFDL